MRETNYDWGYELCSECKCNSILVIVTGNGREHVAYGKVVFNNAGKRPAVVYAICAGCIHKIGFWKNLFRMAGVEFAMAMG